MGEDFSDLSGLVKRANASEHIAGAEARLKTAGYVSPNRTPTFCENCAFFLKSDGIDFTVLGYCGYETVRALTEPRGCCRFWHPGS